MLDFKRLFRFYVNASIHVALAVVSLCVLSAKDLNILVNFDLLGFVFFSTIVCYNFVKYGVEADKYLIVAKPSHRPIQIFSFLAFVACLYFFFRLKTVLWWHIGFLTLISAMYAIPFLPQSKNLRSLGGLKIYLIALIWTGFTVVLQVVDNELDISTPVLVYGVQRFLLVLILILPFEIRDLKYDAPELRTLPQRFGVDQTKNIGYLLIVAYFILALYGSGFDLKHVVFAFGSGFLLILGIAKTSERQNLYYASFWVEGIAIVLLIVNYGIDWIV